MNEAGYLRVAIVGCGKIADAHLEQIRRTAGCQLVGACDSELLMARQACERFGIPQAFENVQDMLATCRPDVVHITTPPQSHYPIARACLEAGCHVYVEKPFALNFQEAESLVGLANQRGVKITVGHDLQFSHAARRMRERVSRGYLGGMPVHMESYYCYDLSDTHYARVFLADKEHWVWRLPGGLLQNVMSHGIARIAEFMVGDDPEVVAVGSTSHVMRDLGGGDLIDELRVIIMSCAGQSAYFTFSSQMKPPLNQFRIYGERNGLILDEDEQSIISLRGRRYKSYAQRFVPPITFACQHFGNLLGNASRFMLNDFHMKAGLRCLIQLFYEAVRYGVPLPIPYREILLTMRIMDSILSQLNSGRPRTCSPGSMVQQKADGNTEV